MTEDLLRNCFNVYGCQQKVAFAWQLLNYATLNEEDKEKLKQRIIKSLQEEESFLMSTQLMLGNLIDEVRETQERIKKGET